MMFLLFVQQHPSGVFVHASGVENSFCDCLDVLEKSYGRMQGCIFRVWVDRISSAQIGSDTWLVKFNKWDLSGYESLVCFSCFRFIWIEGNEGKEREGIHHSLFG